MSRATAYRYFPNPDALLLETQLHLLVQTPEQMFPDDTGEAGQRARRVLDHLQGMTAENETAFRQLMRGVMDRWLQDGGDTKEPLRGGRRITLLHKALEPVRDRMSGERLERLVEALAMIVSQDTYFAGRDICQLSPERIRETMGWVVEEIVAASLRK